MFPFSHSSSHLQLFFLILVEFLIMVWFLWLVKTRTCRRRRSFDCVSWNIMFNWKSFARRNYWSEPLLLLVLFHLNRFFIGVRDVGYATTLNCGHLCTVGLGQNTGIKHVYLRKGNCWRLPRPCCCCLNHLNNVASSVFARFWHQGSASFYLCFAPHRRLFQV